MFNNKRYVLIFLLIALLLTLGCNQSKVPPTPYSEITTDQLYQRIQLGEKLLIIDVRTPEEYVGKLGHIAGAKLLPLQEIESWFKDFEDQKDREIILICRSGNRSGVAARFLTEHGFSKVVNVIGGMRDWNQKGFPVER